MPKLNELQDRPDGIVLPNQLIAIADPATGEMYRLPLSIVLGITNITQPDPAKQILRFWKGPDDYFDIDFTGASPGGGGAASRFGIEDNTSDVDRNSVFNGHSLTISRLSDFNVSVADENVTYFSSVRAQASGVNLEHDADDGTVQLNLEYGQFYATVKKQSAAEGEIKEANIIVDPASGDVVDFAATKNIAGTLKSSNFRVPFIQGDHTLPVSVNGTFADAAGNITLEGGGGGGTDTNFATNNLTFTGNRTHELANMALMLENASYFEVTTAPDASDAQNQSTINSGSSEITAEIYQTGTTQARTGLRSYINGEPNNRIFTEISANSIDANTYHYLHVQPDYVSVETQSYSNPHPKLKLISGGNNSTDEACRLNIGRTLDYADNGAAISAGLTPGDVYRTGDLLKIVH